MSMLDRLRTLTPGTKIPKPKAVRDFLITGWGERDGSRALIYYILNRKHPETPHEAEITVEEWEKAYDRLLAAGEFTKS